MNDIWSAPPKKPDSIQGKVVIGRVSALNEAQEHLKNGILMETNKGLICVSLKDALVNGVGGHDLSVEDFHSVATQLLLQEGPISEDEIERNLFPKNKNALNELTSDLVTTKNICNLDETNQAMKMGNSEMNECHNTNDVYCHVVKSLAKKIDRESAAHAGETLLVEYDLVNSSPNDWDAKLKSASGESLMMSNKMKSVISMQSIFGKFSGKNDSTSDKNNLLPTSSESILIKNELSVPRNINKNCKLLIDNCLSCEETSDNSEAASISTSMTDKTGKKRGGWPKGRKRKPELKNEMRPPKAPATGYVIFLNKKRKNYKDLPFTEVTKLLGNEWSKLSLQDKKIYLDQAEIEKKRYREELRVYRQSDAYQTYLHKKRLKKLQGNGTEESDMDATDEIDDEDNEELYCRSCDQWFHSLHNKKEHLYGRQHLQSLAFRCSKSSDPEWLSANASSTSFDESSLDGSSCLKGSKEQCCNPNPETLNMDETIVKFMVANKEREHERLVLKKKLDESKARNLELSTDLKHLNETVGSLTCLAESEKTAQILLEQNLFNLLNVPTLFYLPEPVNEDSSE